MAIPYSLHLVVMLIPCRSNSTVYYVCAIHGYQVNHHAQSYSDLKEPIWLIIPNVWRKTML